MSNRSVTNDAVCRHFSGVDNSMGCLLHDDTCCGCADKRSPTMGFVKSSGMRNGVMETKYLFRWGFYCSRCKDYWTSRLSKAPPNWSLDFPRRLIALMNSAPPPAEGSTSRARSTSTDTPPVNPFRPIASLGIPSSSGTPPLAVAAPDAGSDIPATVAPPPTSSPATDTPVTAAMSLLRSRTSLYARAAARAAANVPATVAPPPDPTASSPARDTSVTAVPSPVTLNRTIFETGQPAPPPVLSKKAKKNAAKRARAAALVQQRQRTLASQVTPELPNNVSPLGNRASALPSHPVSDLQDAIYRHSATSYPWDNAVPLYRDWDPPQTRLSPLNDSVAEAEPERFGLGYNRWNA
ncbi:hypothetical protein DFP73DRAFT_77029 [Morchella snyderi]|nr:hypothetical protein DFP73DRAFT_77029 [Morchella snyderi]